MSLNKLTDSSVRKNYMNINCVDLKCSTLECDNPPWGTDGVVKLNPNENYINLDLGKNHTLVAEYGGIALGSTLTSLKKGIDGEKVELIGIDGSSLVVKHNQVVGQPDEAPIIVSFGSDYQLIGGGKVMGNTTLYYSDAKQAWYANPSRDLP